MAACGKEEETEGGPTPLTDNETADSIVTNNQEDVDKVVGDNMDGLDHADVTHSTWGNIPNGLKEASNPKFKVGDKVKINAAHNDSMEGSEGTIVGAYESTVFSISYDPTTGDHPEENVKWFVMEEVQGLGESKLDVGSEVIIEVGRKEGMQGAKGTIDTVEKTNVYMVDYVDTEGQEVRNYQWLKESELSPAS